MKCRAALFWLVATGLALAACPKTSQPEVGGETNWLRVCADRGGCGVGSCVCGVCTTECSSESRCSGAFAGSCVSTTSQLGASACAAAEQMPQGLCLPGCANDAECGAGFACRDSVCVTVAIAEHFDTEQRAATRRDAGACRVAERCEQGEWCDWTSAQARALECYMPFAGPYTARCGRYDSVVSRGADSAITYYYGEDGALVGTNSVGLGSEGCVSYDDSFTLPASCTPTSPPCPTDAGASHDASTTDAGEQDAGAVLLDAGIDASTGGNLIVELITEADYYVRNETSLSISLSATGLFNEPAPLLQDTVPALEDALIYHAVEGTGGHVMPSNFFRSFTVSQSGKTLYSGVVNADWKEGPRRYTLTVRDP